MNTEKLKALLAAEEVKQREKEARRREEARKRDEEILRVFQETPDEPKQKWGQVGFEDIAIRNGRDYSDVEASLFSDVSQVELYGVTSPERVVDIIDAVDIVNRIIGGEWGIVGIERFMSWIDSNLVTFCEELGLAPKDGYEIIRKMTFACRKESGADPEYFPFPQEVADLRDTQGKVRSGAAYTRMMSGGSTPSDRIQLPVEILKLPLDACWAAIKGLGYPISRPTAWRAKKLGWIRDPKSKKVGANTNGSNLLGGYAAVPLTKEDREMTPEALMAHYGMTKPTAIKALQRGFRCVKEESFQ